MYEIEREMSIKFGELIGRVGELTRERDQARSIAAMLEAECANCWGPVHAETLRIMGQEANDVS